MLNKVCLLYTSLAVFLRVFPFDIDNQADNHRADNADKQIQRVDARQGI